MGLVIYIIFAGILNIILSYYRDKMRGIIKSKGLKLSWRYRDYPTFKNVINKENNPNDKEAYIKLAKIYIILYRIVKGLMIAFPFLFIIGSILKISFLMLTK